MSTGRIIKAFLGEGGRATHWRRVIALLVLSSSFPGTTKPAMGQDSDGTAGDSIPSNTANWMLISTFNCFVNGCDYENAVLRYEPVTGAFLGVHIANVPTPSGIVVHPTRGTLLVASRSTNRIKEYHARSGAFIRDFIVGGAEGLNFPQAMLFRANGNILVTSSQTMSNLGAFNGILEFNGTTGAFVGPFVNGGYLGQNCGSQGCLFGANAMVYGPNGNIYVTSGSNDMVIEYNGTTGAYVGKFTSSQLVFPTGIAVRPNGTPRAGNILVTTRHLDPGNPNDTHKILEFDKTTRALVTTGATFAAGFRNPGALYWHSLGSLLVIDRSLTETAPNFADRIMRLHRDSGAFQGYFTAVNDNRLHNATGMVQVTVDLGIASNDFDGDGDTDLRDFAALQRCYGAGPSAQCLSAFDDNRNNIIDGQDVAAFHLSFSGPIQ